MGKGLLSLAVAFALLCPPARAGFAPADGSPYTTQLDNPVSIATGDLNGDGTLDLVVPGNGEVRSFLGDGLGSFTAVGMDPFSAANSASGVALADLNDDGALDAMLSHELSENADANGIVAFRPGAGTGVLNVGAIPSTERDATTGLVLGNFTGAPRLDVAAANRRAASGAPAGSVSVIEGTGPGTFGTATAYELGASEPLGIAAADLNGDARQDLTTANADGTVSVLLQDAGGAFAQPPGSPFAAGAINVGGIAAGDLNEDGRQDVALAARLTPGQVAVLLGDGAGALVPAPGSPFETGANNARRIAIADLDGDGHLDLAVTNSQNPGQVSVFVGNGTGAFAHMTGSPFQTSFVELPAGIAIGDFDGDLQPDLALSHSENAARMTVMLNDAAPTGSAADIAFGRQGVGAPVVRPASVTNSGSGVLRVDGVAVTGSDFGIASDDCGGQVLTVGASCQVEVRFSASGLGPRPGALTVSAPLSLGVPPTALTGSGRRPRVTNVSVRPKRFAAGKRSAVRFQLAEKGRVTLQFQRALPGRRRGKKCVRPGRARRGAKRCTRWATKLRLRRSGKGGRNRVRFGGGRQARKLRAGRHRARVVARDPLRNASRPRSARFTVLRP